MKKTPFNIQINVDDLLPASSEDKAYMVKMRPSTTFFKDGVKRLLKNKIATISLITIVIITLTSILLPIFWPYSYDQQLGISPGAPVDPSYNNLAPFEYGSTEQAKIDAGEKVFPHIFGTDAAGRDYLIRIVYGTRISLAVGFFASIIVLIIGMTLDSGLCGRQGGYGDNAYSRYYLCPARYAHGHTSLGGAQGFAPARDRGHGARQDRQQHHQPFYRIRSALLGLDVPSYQRSDPLAA